MTVNLPDFDELDVRVGTALQVNGRASWELISTALKVPVRTIARRGQRLIDTGTVRVSTYLDTTVVGDARPLVIQIGTPPGGAMDVARIVATRSDASSVSVLESGSEVICLLTPRTALERECLVVEYLPGIERVSSVRVGTVLKFFRSGFDWTALPLPEDAVQLLRDPDTRGGKTTPPRVTLSDGDEELIAVLAEDGRATVTEVAERLSISPPTVKRRLDSLLDAGALHVRTEISPILHGLRVEALTWLEVSPDRVERVGAVLGDHPSVRFCAVCTGTTQLLVDCVVADEHALYRFLTEDVGSLGVTSSQTSVVLIPVQRGPMLVTDLENKSDL